MSEEQIGTFHLGIDRCKCGSYAINPHLHGRKKGVDLDLCDVCYWRKRAEAKVTKEDNEKMFGAYRKWMRGK